MSSDTDFLSPLQSASEEQLIDACRKLLAEKRAKAAEAIALAVLSRHPDSRGLHGILYHSARDLFQYDIAMRRAEQLLRMGPRNAWHAGLYLAACEACGALPDAGDPDDLRASYPENENIGRLDRAVHLHSQIARIRADHPPLFDPDTPVRNVVAVLEEYRDSGRKVECEIAILQLLLRRREPALLRFAGHFFLHGRPSEPLRTYVFWLAAASAPTDRNAQLAYHAALLSRGRFSDALECITEFESSTVLRCLLYSFLELDTMQARHLARTVDTPRGTRDEREAMALRNHVYHALRTGAGSGDRTMVAGLLTSCGYSDGTAEGFAAILESVARPRPRGFRGDDRPRVAVCVSGQLRNHRQCLASIRKNLLERLGADGFLCTWDTSSYKFDRTKKVFRFIPWAVVATLPERYINFDFLTAAFPVFGTMTDVVAPVDVRELEENYGFRKVSVLREADFDDRVARDGLGHMPGNQLKMFHTIHECQSLCDAYAAEQGIEYDVVIRIRPDFLVRSLDFDLSRVMEPENRYRVWAHYLTNIGFGDQFAFGSPDAMRFYASAWRYLETFKRVRILDGFSGRMAENLLLEIMFVSGVDMTLLPQGWNAEVVGTQIDLRILFEDLVRSSGNPEQRAFLEETRDVLRPFVQKAAEWLAAEDIPIPEATLSAMAQDDLLADLMGPFAAASSRP